MTIRSARIRALLPVAAVLCFELACSHAVADTEQWSTLGPFGGTAGQVAVFNAAPELVFANGGQGFFRSTDGGVHWQRSEIGLPSPVSIQSFVLGTQSPVIFASSYNTLYKSMDAGSTWQAVVNPLEPGESIVDISLRPGSSTELVLGAFSGVYVSSDAGATWSGPNPSLQPFSLTSVLYAEDGVIYVGKWPTGSGTEDIGSARLIKSSDGGVNWIPSLFGSLIPEKSSAGIQSISASATDPEHVFILDAEGNAYFSLDGGANWSGIQAASLPETCAAPNFLMTDPTRSLGLFLGCGTSIAHSVDATAFEPDWTLWNASNGLADEDGNSVNILSATAHPGYPATPRIWVGTSIEGVFQTVDNGVAWTSEKQGFDNASIRAIAPHPMDEFTSTTVVLAGTDNAAPMYKLTRGGAGWADSSSGLAADWIRSIAIDPTTVDTDPLTLEPFTVYASGRLWNISSSSPVRNAGIYKSSDSGATWTTIDNGIAIVNGYPDMGAVRSLLLDPTSCASPPCLAGSSPLQTVYVAGSGYRNGPGMPYRSARIYKSVDAGAHWAASDTGLPFPQAIPLGDGNLLVSDYIVSMAMDPATPSTLYVGTLIDWGGYLSIEPKPSLSNGVFKSVDAGANWIHSSNGLPRCGGAGSSHCDVIAIAVNPANPQMLFAGIIDHTSSPNLAKVFRSVDAGANWVSSSKGITGTTVRSIAFEADGSAVYVGISGYAANPGGVFRSTDNGQHWNAMNNGLRGDGALALAIPKRAAGSPSKLLLGTNSGVWEHTAIADEDFDGVPTGIEEDHLGGDGNGDSVADAVQPEVATLVRLDSASQTAATASLLLRTVSIIQGPEPCSQLNDVATRNPENFPVDTGIDTQSQAEWGLVRFALPGCASATVQVTFHGAAFGPGWVWRNHGPTVPGDNTTFAWYTFDGATRLDAETWELSIDANALGNYRDDPANILFVGGPASDVIFAAGFE